MPTTVTHIIDPDNGPGTDYTSLSAWEAAQQADLTASDQIKVAECRSTSGTADTTSCTITGWTTDATRYAVVQSSGANKHAGIWDATKYRLSTSGNNLIVTQDYTRIIGIQSESSSAANQGALRLNNTGCSVSKSILRFTGTGANGHAIITANTAGLVSIFNNLILVNSASGTNYGILGVTGAPGTLNVENNTIIRLSANTSAIGIGQLGGSSSTIARNNLVSGFGNTNTYTGTFATGTDNNTTNGTDSIGVGSNNSTSQTFTFTNSAGGDYSLASGDTGARDKGTLLSAVGSGFTDDILSNPRDAVGAIDCGCFEFQATSSVPVFMNQYRQRVA